MHSWYQGMLGTNESMYAWMDEGFTSYAAARVVRYYWHERLREIPTMGLQQVVDKEKTKLAVVSCPAYNSYFNLVKSGLEEPLTTHADHFNTNFAYSSRAIRRGRCSWNNWAILPAPRSGTGSCMEYYRLWRFKHPNASDFVRVAEKVSGMQLDWYKEYWVSTTKTIDYGIDSLWEEGGKAKIRLKMIGYMPMPIDVGYNIRMGAKNWRIFRNISCSGRSRWKTLPSPVRLSSPGNGRALPIPLS
jgi:hypothetical protein